MEELNKQLEDFLKERKDFREYEKKYKAQLDEKDKEILRLESKISFLTKNLKILEKKNNFDNSMGEDKSKTATFINSNIIEDKKCNFTLSKQKIIRNVRTYLNRNNINNKIKTSSNLKNLENNLNNRNGVKKLLIRNMSASKLDVKNIESYSNLNYMNNTNKKRLTSMYNNNKNSSMNESLSNYLCQINENENDYQKVIPKDKSYNNKSQIKLKLPVNITNNNYNMNKNSVMINLSTNILGDNLNLEKLKVQQKLVEYRKLIDKKINELMNHNKRKMFKGKNKRTKSSNKDNKISPKNYFKKINTSAISSDKTRKKLFNISTTNYIFKDKEKDYFMNLNDKKLIIPHKINPTDSKKKSIHNSQKNFKIKYKNKINTNNIKHNDKDNIKNNSKGKNLEYNNIHGQLTSKAVDDKK